MSGISCTWSARLAVIIAAPIAVSLANPPATHAQFVSRAAPNVATPPRVFLDCQGAARFNCDETHFRTEIRFVNWAQDREDADVHVIGTSQSVGGGGTRFTFDFIGRGELEHLTDQFTYTSSGTDVQAETRDGLTRVLQIGLLRYAVELGLGNDFEVEYTGQAVGTVATNGENGENGGGGVATAVAAPRDPWNYWTFRVGLSGNFDLQETSKNIRFNPSFSADRVTEEWKLSLSGNVNYLRNERELSSGTIVKDYRDEWRIAALIVKSVSDHFSVGFDMSARNSVRLNQHARIEFAPAIEYNFFPYAQANRRQFTTMFTLGVQHSNYVEQTIFGVEEQTVPQHRLEVRYNAREQWGNAGVGAEYAQYLHAPGLYEVGLNGNVSFRIVRGLELTLTGNASWIKNDIHTPMSDIPDEEILLGRRGLSSSYQYSGSAGLTYRFGSSFTNIVNTRLDTGPRGGGGGGGGGGGFGGGFGGGGGGRGGGFN